MDLQFFSARNGQLTCSAESRYLHSSFNPQAEAERFVSSISHSFEPHAIIVFGACLSWSIEPLRKAFPHSRLIAIQFNHAFENYSSEWDNVFYVTNETEASLFSIRLFELLGEEKLVASQFVSWKAAENIWPEESRFAWKALNNCLKKAQDILTSRDWFNIRWFKNTVRSLSSITTFAIPEKTDKTVIITASGPSLSNTIPFIRNNRDSFILLAASSSISTLLYNDIVPDFCISTDGGWYAKRHLRLYQTDNRLKHVPLIISAESAIPFPLFSSIPFILLTYGDSVETLLSTQSNIPSVPGLRNGTVSGTAVAFAASLTSGNIYICGLDLAPGKGFQHSEPNENDIPLFQSLSRINTVESFQSRPRFSSGSLALYREWFSSLPETLTSRVFRLISENDQLERLGNMTDVYIEHIDFKESMDGFPKIQSKTTYKTYPASKETKSVIKTVLYAAADYIEEHPEDENCYLWYSSIALKQYVNCLRMNNTDRIPALNVLAHDTAELIREVVKNV